MHARRAAGPNSNSSRRPGSPFTQVPGWTRSAVPRDLIVTRRRNQTVYGNVIFALTPEIETSFEYRWLTTTPRGAAERSNNHFDWVFAYKF